MKHWILSLGLILLWLVLATVCWAEVDQDPQEFNVKFTINYNTMTLHDAALMERKIRKDHEDGCWVKTEVTKSSSIDGGMFVTISSDSEWE